eukprot:jgi/Mesvir1/17537/Mv08789-RA.2
MRYGEFLDALRLSHPDWASRLPDYAALKILIYALHAATAPRRGGADVPDDSKRASGKAVRESDFFREIEGEIDKVEFYALDSLASLKQDVKELQEAQGRCSPRSMRAIADTVLVSVLATKCSQLEKFVNVSYTTFYKILKKHDKLLPNVPCRQFYMARLNQKCWLRELDTLQADLHAIQVKAMGGPSTGLKGEVVAQSRHSYWIHAANVRTVKGALSRHCTPLRDTSEVEADEMLTSDLQADLAETLGDLPPELDATLHNVVYLDNYRLELYHRRLEQFARGEGGTRHGGDDGGSSSGGGGGKDAFLIRLRWKGLENQTVKVERVTSSAEMLGSEAFELPEQAVLPFLQGRIGASDMRQLAESQGKPGAEVSSLSSLVDSVLDQMDAKQMLPMVRVQYCRHAYRDQAGMQFQLDSSILMVKEKPLESLAKNGRWCRDPSADVSHSELHRFPHAVLSLVLPVGAPGDALPDWVQELESMGILRRVDKFDKYLHGAAAVLPELAQSVPYWFGDHSLQASILSSSTGDGTVPAVSKVRVAGRDMGAQTEDNGLAGDNGTTLEGDQAISLPVSSRGESNATNGSTSTIQESNVASSKPGSQKKSDAPSADKQAHKNKKATQGVSSAKDSGTDAKRADEEASAAAKQITSTAIASAVAAEERRRYNRVRHGTGLVGLITWVLGDRPPCPDQPSISFKPKDFLANERTFLDWLHAGATVGSAATAIISYASAGAKADVRTLLFMQQLGIVLLLSSMAIIVYGLLLFHTRVRSLRSKETAQWSNRRGPLGIAIVTVAVMCAIAARGFARMEGLR